MRMWMTDCEIMCRQHLLGEHVEIHMYVGTISKGISIKGYIDNNLLELQSIYARHEQIVKQMKHRQYNHFSPMVEKHIKQIISNLPYEYLIRTIDREGALETLLARCPTCRSNYERKNHAIYH